MKYAITLRFQFCAGHRIVDHESNCRHLHGHNYVAFVTCEPKPKESRRQLDDLGRVIDFAVIKQKVGTWIEDQWDHGLILKATDPLVKMLPNKIPTGAASVVFQKLFLLPTNPTAEHMAAFLLSVINAELLDDTDVHCCRVELWETENCKAVVELPRTGEI